MNKPIKNIYLAILNSIIEGQLKPGDKLPREIEIAEKFKTNRMNAHRALKLLGKEGIVNSRKRVGTFISSDFEIKLLHQLVKTYSKKIMVMCSPNPYKVHWDNSSFTALESKLQPNGYDITYCNIPSSRERDDLDNLLQNIEKNGYGALLIFPDTGDDTFLAENHDLIDRVNIPLYILNRSGDINPFANASEVAMDPLGEGVQIGKLLKKNNCEHVIFYNIPGKHYWSVNRYEGFKFGFTGSYNPEGNYEVLMDDKAGLEGIFRKIKSGEKWTVVAVNNIHASHFIDMAREQGLRAPDDYGIVSFDDSPSYLAYNLTTMARPLREIGEVFAGMLLDKGWMSDHNARISVKVASNLVVRKTFIPEGYEHENEMPLTDNFLASNN